MKKLRAWQVLLAIMIVFGLAACAADRRGNGNDNNMTTRSYGTNQNWTGNRLGDGGDGMNAYGMHANTRMQISQQLADQITAMQGVRSAIVMLTDNNAYVSVQLDRNGQNAGNGTAGGQADVNQQMKQQIVDKVRSSAPYVRNVFVSANPDFVQRMNNYAQDVAQGRPLAGLVQEFNTLVQRIFPTTQGTGDTTGTTGGMLDGTRGGTTGTTPGGTTMDGTAGGIRAGTTQRAGDR